MIHGFTFDFHRNGLCEVNPECFAKAVELTRLSENQNEILASSDIAN